MKTASARTRTIAAWCCSPVAWSTMLLVFWLLELAASYPSFGEALHACNPILVLPTSSNCVFHLLKVVTVTFLFLELVVGALSAVPFRLNMANSRWLGVTSIFATRYVRKWVWPEHARNARCVYARTRTLTDRPAIMSVQCYTGRPYLCLARNMADGRLL